MELKTLRKAIGTALIIVLIDRIEFAYYPFEGVERYVQFLLYDTPIIMSWYVYCLSVLVQGFLWSIVAWMWLPMAKDFKWVVIAFGLCIVEFPLTYGQPITSLPLPWGWFFPISCSLLRLMAVMYYLGCLFKRLIDHEHH